MDPRSNLVGRHASLLPTQIIIDWSYCLLSLLSLFITDMTHAQCMLDHSLQTYTICNTHCYSTATMVTRTGLCQVTRTLTVLFCLSGVPRNFFRGGSTNSVEDRGQRKWGSGGGSPLVRGFTQFANEWNPYSDSGDPAVTFLASSSGSSGVVNSPEFM
jgi:hypothetical protein